MIICPFCEQDYVVKEIVKKSGANIFICQECESVWIDKIDDEHVTNFDDYMEKHNMKPYWSELQILK